MKKSICLATALFFALVSCEKDEKKPDNSSSFEMVFVQGGSFQMGSTSLKARYEEQPVHSVTLSSFYIGKTEVTQKLWSDVMGGPPVQLAFKKCDDCPVENVSWDYVQVFIAKLNQQTGKNYRLPTEAEWEFAARGGLKDSPTDYAGSNTIDDVAWYDKNSDNKTHSVGTKQPNELGLYDMSGNVEEWCFDPYFAYSSEAQTNPQGPASGGYKVVRGGCWDIYPDRCRVTSRIEWQSNKWVPDVGFRLAQSSN
jgi:formylglycine-generating enzyme required for sulfatase activity